MSNHELQESREISVPVREGRYEYVLVRTDGESSTIPVTESDLEAGMLSIRVREGERVMEVGRSSTSDPDYDPPLGQLWPRDEG